MATILEAYIERAVRTAILEHSERAELSEAEQDRLLELEATVYDSAFEAYKQLAENPTKAEFNELWKESLKHDLLRERRAIQELSTRQEGRRRYSL